MKKIVTGKNIVKTYGQNGEQTTALRGVNAAIAAGEFVAVMGPSGCGKSSLLFALSGTDTIDGGSVDFGDKALATLDENALADVRRSKMGFVFQQPTMLKNLNLLDNIILPAAQTSKKRPAAAKRAQDLMDKTGIGGLGRRNTSEVSGGQLQRASICRALINQPDILFADEPTGALNSAAAEEIMALFCSIHREGTAILLVTHDAKVAARADRVLFMKDGEIASELRFGQDDENLEARAEKIIAKTVDAGI